MAADGREAGLAAAFAAAVTALVVVWVPLTDFADAQGDTLEYQSLGANCALGLGFPTFGLVRNEAAYRFGQFDQRPGYYDEFRAAGAGGGRTEFLRAPGYPLFLAAVYRVFGVRPLAAKRLQLALVLVIALSLPWVGRAHWGPTGTVAGAIAAPLFVLSFGRSAGYILAETLSAFTLWALLVSFPPRRAPITNARAVWIGFLTGVALLTKATAVFIAPMVLVLVLGAEGRGRRAAAGCLLGLFVVLAPYSTFASKKAGRFVFLSTQGGGALLDDNNEIALRKGEWAKQWRGDPSALYNQPGWKELPAPLKVARFYLSDWTALPRALKYKFDAGLERAYSWKLLICLLLCDALLGLGAGRLRRLNAAHAASRLLFVLAAGSLPLASVLGHVGGATLCAALLLCWLAASVTGSPSVPDVVPGVAKSYFLNFVLVFAVFDGNYRFISVLEWLALMLGCLFGLDAVVDWGGWFNGDPGPSGPLSQLQGKWESPAARPG
ncbi:hypothetical protein EPO15_09185 [bacterium]|nr:MAG: hypothetical protein EPO15_09185 [bacterium]